MKEKPSMTHEVCRKKILEAYAKGYAQGRQETYEQVMREAEKMLKFKERPCQSTLTN